MTQHPAAGQVSATEIEQAPSGPFVDFERDDDAETGVMWDAFVTAVGIYVYTNEGAYEVTVSDIALAFNTTPELVREAVDEHPWLYSAPHDDPSQQLVESDGE